MAAYAATRDGVSMLTETASIDCARPGYDIRINSIHPGYTHTNLVQRAVASLGPRAEEFAQAAVAAFPLRRLADLDEIAGPIALLASDDARYMVGNELIVDGGYSVV